MPIVDTGPYTAPFLLHNAPINESTKKVREMFKVDEETGYPEHYKWRKMAKLPPRYRPEEVFEYLGKYEPEREISTTIFTVFMSGMLTAIAHSINAMFMRRSVLAKMHWIPINTALLSGVILWGKGKAHTRQGLKNKIIIDYCKKHPERFGEVYRPKLREVLTWYVPTR